MPSLLLLRSSSQLGGVERQLLDHARRLQRVGLDPVIVSFFRGDGEHPLVVAAASYQIPAFTITDPSPWSLAPFRRLRSLIASLAPALIHTCDYRSDVLAYLARCGCPQVAESHGHTAESQAMKTWNRADSWVLRRLPAVVAVSTAWETALSAAGTLAKGLHVVGNSVAVLPPSPPPAPAKLAGRGPHLLYAGRISPEKGLDIPLQIWPEIRQVFPTAQLWVLGATSPRTPYQHRLHSLFEQPGIHVFDYQPDIRPWLQAADVVLAPSRREAWGMTVFEALCAGVPVLASRVGGLPHLCRDAPHACLIPSDDPSAILGGLHVVLMPDFPRGASLGQSYHSQPRFDPAMRHQRLLDIYQTLL